MNSPYIVDIPIFRLFFKQTLWQNICVDEQVNDLFDQIVVQIRYLLVEMNRR